MFQSSMGFRLILGFDRAFVSKRHWSEKPRINAHGRITGVPYTTFDAGLPEKSRSCLKCPPLSVSFRWSIQELYRHRHQH